jgi:hypothetical protein
MNVRRVIRSDSLFEWLSCRLPHRLVPFPRYTGSYTDIQGEIYLDRAPIFIGIGVIGGGEQVALVRSNAVVLYFHEWLEDFEDAIRSYEAKVKTEVTLHLWQSAKDDPIGSC